jgi:hypothetical protein
MSGGVCLSDDPLEDENDALRAHGDRIVEGLLQYIGEKKLRGLGMTRNRYFNGRPSGIPRSGIQFDMWPMR